MYVVIVPNEFHFRFPNDRANERMSEERTNDRCRANDRANERANERAMTNDRQTTNDRRPTDDEFRRTPKTKTINAAAHYDRPRDEHDPRRRRNRRPHADRGHAVIDNEGHAWADADTKPTRCGRRSRRDDQARA